MKQGLHESTLLPSFILDLAPDAIRLPILSDDFAPTLMRGDVAIFRPNQDLRQGFCYLVTHMSITTAIEELGRSDIRIARWDGKRTVLDDFNGLSEPVFVEDVVVDGLVIGRLPQYVAGKYHFEFNLEGWLPMRAR